MQSTNNIDLVSQEDLDRMDELNRKAQALQKTLPTLGAEAEKLAQTLSKGGISFKDLLAPMEAVDKVEKTFVSTQKELVKVEEQREAIRQKVIRSTSEEVKNMEALKVAAQGIMGTTEQNIARLHKEEAALKAVQKERKLLLKIVERGGDLNQRQAAFIQASTQRELEHKQAISELRLQLKAQTKEMQAAEGSLKQRELLLARLRNVYKQLNDEERNSQFGNLLHENIQKLDADVKTLNGGMGVFNDNVGNYTGGITDLTKSISIANPTLAALTRKVLTTTGAKQAWTKVNQALVKSLDLTAKTANLAMGAIVGLVATGVTLAVKAIKKLREEYEEAAAQIDATNTKIAENITAYKTLQIQWNSLANDLNAKKKFVDDNKTAFENLGTEVLNVGDAEAVLVGKTEAVLGSLRLRAKAAAQMEIATEKYKQALIKQQEAEAMPETIRKPTGGFERGYTSSATVEVENKHRIRALKESGKEIAAIDKLFDGAIQTSMGANQALIDAGIKVAGTTKDRSKEQQKAIDAEKQAIKDLALFNIQQEAEANKTVYKDKEKSYTDRLSALDAFLEKQRESIRKAAENQSEGKGPNEQALIQAKANAELIKLDREAAEARKAISKDYADSIIKDIQDIADARAREINLDESNALAGLAEQYAAGIITAEQYEARKTEIARKSAMDRYDAEIAMLQDQLNAVGLTAEQREALEKKLADARVDYQKHVNDQIVSDEERSAKEREKIEKDLADKRKELAKSVVSFISALYSRGTENQIRQLEKESEANEEHTDSEIARIERLEESGAISKEQADARKAAIDEQSRQREEELERKKAEAQKRQAVFEKGIQVAQIMAELATALFKIKAQAAILLSNPITAPFASMALAQIPIISGIAGANIAAVLTTPIPQYAHGTADHPGGLAVVGDGGRHEGIVTPSGMIYKTPKTDTLINLPAHSAVYPDVNKMYEQMAFTHIDSVRENKNGTITTKELESLQKQNIRMLSSVNATIGKWRHTQKYDSVLRRTKNVKEN